ncbi:MAG TPA: site-2 protease family protein [Solirubrobacteraceae bacterium]
MSSGSSYKLATLFGIRIGVSSSWFLILGLLLFFFTQRFETTLEVSTSTAFAVAAAAAVLFFGSILLHELGHALAAKREGIGVEGIDLFLFGGVMKMSREGGTAGSMFRIAAAGPAVTLLIILAVGGLSVALLGWTGARETAELDAPLGTTALEQLVALVLALNIVLLIFNLLPALPLDGGQILRSAVWGLTGDRSKGTRIAALLGQLLSYLLMAYGAFQVLSGDTGSGLWSVALGFMIGQGARAAAVQSEFTERLEGITIADVMDRDPVTIPAALDTATAYEDFFERYQGWDWFAVVEEDGRFSGLAHRAAMRHAALEEGGRSHARDVAAPTAEESRVQADAPLEDLLGSEPLRRLGALMAVDGDGRLQGVVTLEQVSRALRANLA